MIMQENRSFDSYFGTFPGAAGIPMKNGTPSVCVPDSQSGQCVEPYVDHADVNGGGPHSAVNATADINGGQMNGFVDQADESEEGMPRYDGSGVRELGDTGCDGLSHPRATSRTTGRTRRTSCSKTTCSNPTRRGVSPSICSKSRNGPRTAPNTTTLRVASTRSRTPGSPRLRGDRRPAGSTGADLRVD